MMIPVRCFSCGKVLGEHYDKFKERTAAGESGDKVLDELGVSRYCCRRMLFSHVDTIDEINKYKA